MPAISMAQVDGRERHADDAAVWLSAKGDVSHVVRLIRRGRVAKLPDGLGHVRGVGLVEQTNFPVAS